MPREESQTWIIDDLPVGVWVAKAPGGEFVYANKMFGEIMGMNAIDDVAVGEYAAPYGICSRTGELYPESGMPFVRAMQERRTVIVDDIVIHRRDGTKVYIRAQARPVFEGDEITHVVIAFIDITREAEAELARAESEARLLRAQKLEAVGKLAGGIAHDFNNLLATVKLLASTLRIDETDPSRASSLDQIEHVTDSAVQLTRALLGFARRGRNLRRPVGLNRVVGQLAPILARTLGDHIQVETRLEARRDAVVGDVSQLEQVLVNLVVNARDAMPEGGTLTVRTCDRGDHVVLEVTDTGTGIAPEIRDRIFEPYFTTKSDLHPGAGLGLATVWGIVENHQGTIEALDAPPHGTTMRVSLPSVGQAPAEPAPANQPLQRGRGLVLLVDDDAGVRASGRLALEALGYEVELASDGFEAIERVRARRGDIAVVLLDLVMPRLNGRGAFEAIRALDPSVKVLVTTAATNNEEVQDLLDRGANGFVPKPFSVGALSVALAALRSA
jgi:two-component system cell cycle sensor histidine kinase/response regulator CckA